MRAQFRGVLILAATSLLVACGSSRGEEILPPEAVDPNRISFESVQVDGLVANGKDEGLLLLRAYDRRGRPAASRRIALRSSVKSDLLHVAERTDAQGSAWIRVRATRAGPRTLDLSVDGVRARVQPLLVFAAGPPDRLAFLVSPPSAITAGQVVRPAVTVEVQDAQGNRVHAESQVTVAARGVAAAAQVAEVEEGVARFPALRIDPVARAVQLRATAPGLREAVSDPFDVQPGAATQLAFERQPPAVVVAGEPFLVTVAVRDAAGNLATETRDPVFLHLSANPPGAPLLGVREVVPKGGIAVFQDLGVEVASGGYRLSAFLEEQRPTVSRTFTVVNGEASVERTSLEVQGGAVLADGNSKVQLRVSVADRFGNPVPGVPLQLSASGTGHVFHPSEGLTSDAFGKAEASVASTFAEAKVIALRVDDRFELEATVVFVAGPPDAERSELLALPATAVADGSSEILLEVRLRDGAGNPVADQPLNLSTTGAGMAFPLGTSAKSDAQGVARFRLTSTVAEPKTVSVDAGLFAMEREVQFLPGPPSSARSSLVGGDEQQGVVGTWLEAPFVVELRDENGNPVTGWPVLFELAPEEEEEELAGAELSAEVAHTDSSGRAETRLRLGDRPGVHRVAWQGGWLDGPPKWIHATALEPAGHFAIVQGDRQWGVQGERFSAPLVVRVLGAEGPLEGRRVDFECSAGDAALEESFAFTDADGLAWIHVQAGVDEPSTVKAELVGDSLPPLTFRLFPDPAPGPGVCTGYGAAFRSWDGAAPTLEQAGVFLAAELPSAQVQIELAEAFPGRPEAGLVLRGVALACVDDLGEQTAILRQSLETPWLEPGRDPGDEAIDLRSTDAETWELACDAAALRLVVRLRPGGEIELLRVVREEGAAGGGAVSLCGDADGDPLGEAAGPPLAPEASLFSRLP